MAQESLRALFVEDSEDDATLTLLELERGGFHVESRRVDTLDALQKALAEDEWDIVISDHAMPDFSGPEALRVIQTAAPHLPFIVVSGSMGEDSAVAAMRAGASDYFIKGQTGRLPSAIRRELSDAQARRQHAKAEEQLRQTEHQLRQMQKMEAIGRLAAGIAHDFNNLLTAILGYSEFILQEIPADDKIRPDVEEIRNSGKRASALTRQLLAFSRQQAFEVRVLDINEAIRNVEKLLRRLIGADVKLTTDLGPTAGQVSVDPGQLEQVLINLCVNSRDAMPGGGELTIRTARETLTRARALETAVMEAGDYVAITVADTGGGMTPETRSQCLEPFFTTKAPGFGTGLGLSTVFGIIKQSGGYIHIESEAGAGTAITVYLPHATQAAAVSNTGPESVAPSVRASETVLLVDDDTVIRTLLQRVLKQSGYTVLTAADGVEAKAMFEAHRDEIHAMVTDMIMPKMSGGDLIRAVKAARPDVKILLMSGYSTDWREGRVQGHYTYMQKPFTARELERKLREVLDGGPAQH